MKPTKDSEYLRQAYIVAMRSTDNSTQNGAIIVDTNGQIVGRGANHFPKGVEETSERLARPTKYTYVVHAETNSIYDAARRGNSTEGATMYSPWAACGECAKAIIQSGIIRIVVHKEAIDQSHNQWPEAIKIALEMFREAGVAYVVLSAQFGDIDVLFNGQSWKP